MFCSILMTFNREEALMFRKELYVVGIKVVIKG